MQESESEIFLIFSGTPIPAQGVELCVPIEVRTNALHNIKSIAIGLPICITKDIAWTSVVFNGSEFHSHFSNHAPYELMMPIRQFRGDGGHLDGDGAVSCPKWTSGSPRG